MQDVTILYTGVIKIRDVKKYRYIAAAALAVLIFVLGVLASDSLDDIRTSSLEDSLDQNLVELEDQQLQLSYLGSEDVSCSAMKASITDITKDYNSKLSRVQTFQDRSFFKGSEYEKLKQRYILSGIRYWMFSENLRKECNTSTQTVLFFVPDLEQENCEECSRMGKQLNLLKSQYRDELLIFTVPTGMDGIVNLVEKNYNITETPAVVLNNEKKLQGYHSRQEIERELNLTVEQ